jgi:hypothetical protein
MYPEFEYLTALIKYRLNRYFPSETEELIPAIPELSQWQLPAAKFIADNNLTIKEAIILLIALTPQIQPDLFDRAIEEKLNGAGDFPKIGGVRGKNSRAFLPTGETALFLLSDDDVPSRLLVQQFFGADHLFGQKKVLWLEDLGQGEPHMSGKIILSQDYADTFMYGKPSPPHFSMTFPAKLIREKRSWQSLVINEELEKQIAEIITWLKYNPELMENWGMRDHLKKGYRALFYGPPGTGKTLTAGLLANEIGRDIYKIDLSMVVSKYIGETEKNLELLFARAEDKNWILFFDEADALFGKRTNIRDAHDKYANQEVSYLLQRIEEYNGLIILATNMKNNIDDAFMRRFNSILKFPFPDARERSLIWKKSFPVNAVFANDYKPDSNEDNKSIADRINLPEMVNKYDLAGGSIINVVHYASLKAIERKRQNAAEVNNESHDSDNSKLVIYLSDVLQGIKRELSKEGKPFIS